MPNRTFALLVSLSFALIAMLGWSTHHLLLAGAPALATGGGWPGLSCLLLPLADDLAPHLASYGFLLAIMAGTAAGLRAFVRQQRQTRALLRACLAARAPHRRALLRLARQIGLQDRLDVVDVATPVAFCYGYVRPRVLVSTGLVDLLPGPELEALLLHEREHLRQRDPLKLALGKLLSSSLFFVPLAAALYRHYLVEKELAADDAAIREHGSTGSLAAALITIVDAEAWAKPALSAGADDALDARIAALLGQPNRPGLRLGLAQAAASLLVVLLAALPLLALPPPGDESATSHDLVAGCHLAPPATARA